MKLKQKELIAITHLAFYIISADGIATEDEFSAISTELITFGLEPEEIVSAINAANDMTLEESIAICRTMNSPQKTYACSVMGYIVASDGDIDDDEMKVWQEIVEKCDFPDMSIQDALDNINFVNKGLEK
ncbi:MAG: TerB family tellurite resistance protein [Bacteroidales bacterium]|nr:TerB family tellurite resistance protein [Bacteroidales bacterium]